MKGLRPLATANVSIAPGGSLGQRERQAMSIQLAEPTF